MPVELNEQEIQAIQSGDLTPLKPVLDLGLNVRTTQQQQEYETNLISGAIKKHDSSTYSHIDKLVAETTGVEREANEKTADYVSRAMPALKSQQEQLQSELKELKEKRAEGEATGEEKKRITTLEKLLKEQNDTIQNLTKEKDEAVKGVEARYARTSAEKELLGLKYKIDKEYVSDVLQARMSKFYAEHDVVIENGVPTVVRKSDGEPELDKATLKPVAVAEVMKRYVSDLLDTATAAKGSGVAPDGKKTSGDENGHKGDYSAITTSMELTAAMMKDGYVTDTADFDKVYNEVRAEYRKKNGKDMPLGRS